MERHAQQGSGGAWTAGAGSPAYLEFFGAAANPQIACALNAGTNCSILLTPKGTGGLYFQNGNGGNAVQILGTSVPPGDTFQYIPNSAGPATFTASIGATFTGTGSGTTLAVTSVSGVIHPGSASTASITGTGVPTGVYIVSQTSGTVGSAGVYVTNNPTTSSDASITATSTTMDVTGMALGTIAVGQSDSGIGIANGTTLTALIGGGGTGGVGPYTISQAQYAPSTTVTALGNTVTLQTSNSAPITLNPSLALTGTVSFNNNGVGAAAQQKFRSVFNVTGIDSDIGQQAAGIFNINASFENTTSFASAPPVMSINTQQLGIGYARNIAGLQVFANLASTPTSVPGTWTATTAYANGSMMYDASADLFQTFTGGVTGSIEPTLAGCNPFCTDGTVTWTYTGSYLYGIAGTVATQFYGEINANQGGTAAATMGTGWGLLGGIIVGSSGTYTQAAIAQELDINVSPTGTAAPGSLVGLGIYSQAAGQGRFADTAVSIKGNPGDYRKNAIQFGSTLDPNAGVALSVFDNRGSTQYGAGLIDCSQCGNFSGTQSQSGNDTPFILKSPYFDLLVTGDMRVGYGLIHVTSNGFTLDVPNYAISGNSGFSGGTGWSNGEEACDSLGNCGTVTQSGGVPSGVAVYTDTYIPGGAVPGATPVTWHAVSISSPGPTGGTTEGTPFTTLETYAQASSPTIGVGGVSAAAINIGNSASTTTVAGALNATGALTLSASGTALNVTNNAMVGGTLGVTGVATFSSAPSITGGTINLQGGSKVTSNADGINLTTNNGVVLALNDSGQTVSNGITIQTSSTSTNPVKVTTAGTGGITITSQFANNRGTLGAVATSSNSVGLFSAIYGGVDGNTSSPSGIFTIYPIYQSGYVNSAAPTTLYLRTVVQAGVVSAGFSGLYGNVNQTGAPGALPAWTTGTSYALGAVVQNAYYMYGATNAGTSGATAPTCGSGTCSDGSITWQFQGGVGNYMQIVGGGFDATNTGYNDGGTASVSMGGLFGAVFGAIAGSGATYLTQVVGGEDDCSLATGASSNRFVCFQYVRTGGAQGSKTDVGISIAAGGGIGGAAGYRDAILFQNAMDPNGVAIEFGNQFGGSLGLQTMAGAFDCILCSTTGANNFTNGAVGTGGGGYIVRGPNAQLLGSGDLQLGSALFHISGTGLTIDTSQEQLTAIGTLSGGTNWQTGGGSLAYDTFGNQGYVTASSGVPTSVAIAVTTFIPSSSVPSGAVTWCPEGPSGYVTPPTIPGCFTASEIYIARTTLGIGTAAATAINIGNAGSTTTILGTFGLTQSTPTSSSAACAAGQFVEDASYLYACTASNTWKRVALSTF